MEGADGAYYEGGIVDDINLTAESNRTIYELPI